MRDSAYWRAQHAAAEQAYREAPVPEPRAAPGVALPPIGRAWEDIQEIALRDGYAVVTLNDLVSYNRSRVRVGKPPFAIHKRRCEMAEAAD